MILLFILLAAAALTLTLFPDIPLGRALHRWLVQYPATALSRFGLGRAIVLTGLGGIGLVLFWIGEAEGLRLFAMGAPEAFAWMAMFDAGAVIDLIAISFVTLGATRLRPMRDRLLETLRRFGARLLRPARHADRAVRAVARRRPSGRRDDAEPRPAFGLQPAFG